MDFLTDLANSLDLDQPWVYVALFLMASMVMVWRLEAMLDHGLEGTALGTLVMPYCSGLGNLIFVAIMVQRKGSAGDVMTNCLVNNATNLTLLLGLPALLWGLQVVRGSSPGGGARKGGAKGGKEGRGGGDAQQINRLSLLLTLIAVLFFCGALWALGRDGRITFNDGLVLVGLFLFWQCFQVFDVWKHNVRRHVSFGILFYIDVLVVAAGAYGLYVSIDWLVEWLSHQRGGFLNASNLGWLSGWLMVVPNGLLALYWGWKRRADVVYSSQVGDGHVCIPLCVGLYALARPVPVTDFTLEGIWLLVGATGVHLFFLVAAGGLPRWAGALLLGGYGWFLWSGLAG